MKRLLAILLIFVLLFVTGCNVSADNEKNDDDTKPIVEEPEEPIPEPKLQIIDLESKSRSIAAMINNHNTARPYHAGLQDAYLVYEIIVEGGITRLMAVFKDQTTEKIGSIRSARHYFLDYALENDAIYIHHGQSPQAQRDFSNLKIDRIAVDAPKTAWRDTSLNVAWEHKLFTSIDKIKNGFGKKRTESDKKPLLSYSIEEISISDKEGAIIANNVEIKYSYYMTSSYIFDPVNQVYNRFANGVAHTDYVTKQQYTFKNIIIQKVTNYSLDNYGRQDLKNIGTGEGYYITNGYAIPITWKKESRSSQTIYQYLDGTEITVNDGNTFIQIQPKNQSLSITG